MNQSLFRTHDLKHYGFPRERHGDLGGDRVFDVFGDHSYRMDLRG